MSEIKTDVLRRQLKSGDLARCYLLYGQERYLLDYYTRELRKAVLGAEDDPFNLRRLDGKGLDLQELEDAVDAYPSFAEKTLVEVADYDLFAASEGDQKRLKAILQDLPDCCCLVFRYDALEFKQDKRKKQLCELVRDYVTSVEFPLQKQDELTRWVQKHFRARGKEISADNAAYLIFLCGSLMENLTNEIGKIAVYAKAQEISRADIDAVTVPVVEAETFKLADALSAKDYEKAADLMYKLFQLNTEPIAINALVGGQLRKLYAALLVKKAGGNAGTLRELLGASSDYMPKQYIRICTSFSEAWYREMIRRSAETDYRMKSSAADGEDLLRDLFAAMAVRS